METLLEVCDKKNNDGDSNRTTSISAFYEICRHWVALLVADTSGSVYTFRHVNRPEAMQYIE
jgi:hypothetical protein